MKVFESAPLMNCSARESAVILFLETILGGTFGDGDIYDGAHNIDDDIFWLSSDVDHSPVEPTTIGCSPKHLGLYISQA